MYLQEILRKLNMFVKPDVLSETGTNKLQIAITDIFHCKIHMESVVGVVLFSKIIDA